MAVVALAALTTGCGGQSGGSGTTFTMAIDRDPGNLDPNQAVSLAAQRVVGFAYDDLIYSDDSSGQSQPWLAQSWKASSTAVTFTLRPGITCSDGSPFDAATVAANFNYIGNEHNGSTWLGHRVAAGTRATAVTARRTVTVVSPTPDPFLLRNLGAVPMVCAKGLHHPASLRTTTDGTGLFHLDKAVAGDQYTFTQRRRYAWGPNGMTAKQKGIPDTVVLKVVTDVSTAANLLLAQSVNAAEITGPDLTRVNAQKLFSTQSTSMSGELWFNQQHQPPAADPAVRRALILGVDLGKVRTVLTDGRGQAATNLNTGDTLACPGDTVSGQLPTYDPNAAATALDRAGWTKDDRGIRRKNGVALALRYIYVASADADAAAEFIQSQWQSLGVQVTLSSLQDSQLDDVLFKTGNWNVANVNIQGSLPTTQVPFLSGPTPPNGQNFAGVHNDEYAAQVAQATKRIGTSGCTNWNNAQSALLKDLDIVPIGVAPTSTFGWKATWRGDVEPTSIRMH